MNKIRLDLSDREAELLYLAITTVINASSPQLMQRQGWEDPSNITATTLMQNIFDCEDLETLNNIAVLIHLRVDSNEHNAHHCGVDNNNCSMDFNGEPNQSTQSSQTSQIKDCLTQNLSSNIFDLNAARNRKRSNTL